MELVRWERRPRLRRPVLVAAFEGWNDAGDAATTALRYLATSWGAERIATFDSEELFDFTQTRPEVRLVDGETRHIDWPSLELSAATVSDGLHDVVFLIGPEPQLRWRTFCAAVLDAAKSVGVEMAISLGALLTDIPHTKPVRVTGTAASPEMVGRLGLRRSTYEGPTGITGVLQDAFTRAGIPGASLWATVPHYVSQVPSPKAALALVERTAEMLEAPISVTDLQIGAAAYERQVTERVEADEEAIAYVRQLEEAADDEDEFGDDFYDDHDDEDDTEGLHNLEIPSTDALAAEVERFLRDQRRD
jgi:predicted ATP-grasp superfamily ATP-dependent carboligase